MPGAGNFTRRRPGLESARVWRSPAVIVARTVIIQRNPSLYVIIAGVMEIAVVSGYALCKNVYTLLGLVPLTQSELFIALFEGRFNILANTGVMNSKQGIAKKKNADIIFFG